MPDVVADLVSKVLKVFNSPLSLRANVVEMLMKLAPGLLSSFARRRLTTSAWSRRYASW